tara:strand:- start:1173 stop:2486 length:1314 start_codon:yes stop_codon:yes gene_type:complete
MKVNTVIIGAGISGLSAAHFLSKKTNDFVVLESKNKIGGILQTISKENFICENGPNTVLLNNEAIIELIKDCGLWKDIIYPTNKSNKNRFVLHQNIITNIPTNINSFITTPLLSLHSKFRLIKELFIKKHNQNTTVFNFINKRFGREFHDQLIEPFLTGIYAGDTKKMSAQHTLKLLWKLEQKHGSIIKGLIKRKGTPIDAFNLPNGLSELISKIAFPIKDNIKIDYNVKQIIKNDLGYKIISDSESITCDNVICTVPAYALKELIWDHSFSKVLSSVNYNPIDVFHFGVDKKAVFSNKKGFGILTKPSDGKSFLGILFSSQIFNHVCPSEKELYTVLVGGERQKELCALNKEDLEKIIVKEFKDLIQYEGEIIFKNHFKWFKGIPQYNMNQSSLINSIGDFEKSNSNFHIIGNYFNGISVSDCVKNAKNKIDLILL